MCSNHLFCPVPVAHRITFLLDPAVDEILPTDVHMAMFIPALEYQTSPEQRDKWLPLAKSFKILGAYAQTELGHGNPRSLSPPMPLQSLSLSY